MDKWIKFSEELPTDKLGGQVDILFGHPKWATFMRGMYTHFPDEPLRERISEYNPENDKFHSWETTMMPTHWYRLPDNPTED